MHDLAQGMDTAVSTTGALYRQRMIGNSGQGPLDTLLDSLHSGFIGLPLPAAIIAAIVFQAQSNTHWNSVR